MPTVSPLFENTSQPIVTRIQDLLSRMSVEEKASFEIVQLYIQDHHASLIRPTKELKDFIRIWLGASVTQRITFNITPQKLGFYATDKRFIIESGTFGAFVGTHSEALQEIEIELMD